MTYLVGAIIGAVLMALIIAAFASHDPRIRMRSAIFPQSYAQER